MLKSAMARARGRGELELIERVRRASAWRPMGQVRVGIGDDCAVVRPRANEEIVVTTDFCLEGRHFRRDWHTAESAGHRCLARGLSDLAAMGARPVAAFLSLALPAGTDKKWVAGFFRGLRALADAAEVPLAGGDTAGAPGKEVLADIVLLGATPHGKALLRSGARAGDLLYVTGRLGGAAAELELLRSVAGTARRAGKPGEHPQMFPEPRLGVGRALLRRALATACLDVSDGLSTDLQHLCDASGVGAEVELGKLPVHELARGPVELALHGGEDYELLFSARPGTRVPGRIAGVEVTRVGRFVAGRGMVLVDADGGRRRLKAGGWEHGIG